jgi:hypothetical protein
MICMKIVVEGILVTPFVDCLLASETRQLCSDAQAKAHHSEQHDIRKVTPMMPLSRENANKEAAAAGVARRCTATTVCASPFVAPSGRLFDAAAAVNC